MLILKLKNTAFLLCIIMMSASVAIFSSTAVQSEAQRKSPADDGVTVTWDNIYKRNYGAASVSVSPDGSRLAVTARTSDLSGIFLVPADGGEATFWVEGNSPAWFADGKRIVYSADGDLWTVAVGSSTPTRVTSDQHRERAAAPSPDGSVIAFYSGRGGYQDVWLVPSDGSGPPKQLTHKSMASDDFRFGPSWSPGGTRIVYFSNKSDYWEDDVWIVDIATGKERQLTDSFMVASQPTWSPDGSKIAVMGNAKSGYWYEDLQDIYLIDPDNGAETQVQMQIPATDLLHNHRVYWSGDGTELFFPYHERAQLDLWRVPAEGGVATRVTNMGGAFFNYHAAANGSRFAFVRSTATRGRDVDVVNVDGGAVQQATHFATEWRGLVSPQEISFRSWDGLYIQGFMFHPPGFDRTKKYPALVMVHGGGTNSYYKLLSLNEQRLAQQGYVVFAVNYRGGSGFGRPFQNLGINDWGNGQALDAAAAGEFLKAQPWSTGKVGIYGYSYGGITSMAAITRAPKVFDAAVPMAGIYDFGDAYQNADRVGKIFIKTGHSGSPEEKPEIYAISNALSRVAQVETPLLIMHGEKDVRAPFRQYELAVEILKREGKTFESKSFPGEPHGFRNPDNRVELYTRLEAWFDRWLKRDTP